LLHVVIAAPAINQDETVVEEAIDNKPLTVVHEEEEPVGTAEEGNMPELDDAVRRGYRSYYPYKGHSRRYDGQAAEVGEKLDDAVSRGYRRRRHHRHHRHHRRRRYYCKYYGHKKYCYWRYY